MSAVIRPLPPSREVLAAVELMRGAPGAWKTARGAVAAQAVLLLHGLHTEARAVQSVAHMRQETMLLTLTGLADERGREATNLLLNEPCSLSCTDPGYSDRKFHRVGAPGCAALTPCGRLCVLVNQGPCACRVPDEVASLRRRQRALLWAVETILKGDP